MSLNNSRSKVLRLASLQPTYLRRLFLHSLTLNGLYRSSRPEIGFLQVRMRRPTARLISTETKEWLKHEVKNGIKYSVIITVTGFFIIVMASGIQEEYRARIYPTPDEWNWNTRLQFRAARAREDSEDPWMKNWMAIGNSYLNIIEKLEDPNGEGQGIHKINQSTIDFPVKIGWRLGYDISQKSETWRRGYYEVLMGLVRVAEILDNHVKDQKRISNLAWPASSVIGPSNLRPRPVPMGMPPPPKEEDCAAAFEAPEFYYTQILTTRGFTEKQKIDASISYGLWLEYKGKTELAQKVYKWAVDKATSNSVLPPNICDPSTYLINNTVGIPSQNLLAATTALALHYATNSKVELALPMFISILRARKSLPSPPSTMLSILENVEDEPESVFGKIAALISKYATPPKYPLPPTDGTTPPYRDAKERCEEAGLMLYIGEILYAFKGTTNSSQEDGLAWTREAVDNAETELRQKKIDADTKKICTQCLKVGLQNWTVMVEKLAREEQERKKSTNHSWLTFGSQRSAQGRWESEKEVIHTRLIRANSLLQE